MKSPRCAVYLGRMSLVLGSLGAMSCGIVAEQTLADRLDSPVVLSSHPVKPIAYVLNSVLGAGYESGSLQSYSVTSSQKPELLKSESTPRLGTALAVAQTGEFLLAGFSGSNAFLQVYSIDSAGIASATNRSSDLIALGERRIKSIQVSKIAGESDWSIAVASNLRSGASSVFSKLDIYRYSVDRGFSRLLTAPDDFYQPSKESALGAYSLSWSAPVIFENLGLAAAFPQPSSGYQGELPTAYDWLRGENSGDEADLRVVSALVIDLKKLFAGSSVKSSIGFVPLAFTKDGRSGQPQQAADAPENEGLQFKVNYSAALALDAGAAPCQLSTPSPALKANAAVVSHGSKASVLSMDGFDQVGLQLRSKLDANIEQPILGQLLNVQPVALSVAGEADSLITHFSYVRSGSLCTVGWLRTEQGVNSLGAERSFIQIANTAGSAEHAKIQPSLRGTAGWAVVSGSSLLTGSFGANQLQQFEFDGVSLIEGGKYP